MPRKRPAAVTTLGVLNIVFGSLGLVGSLCCGTVFGIVYSAARTPTPGGLNLAEELLNVRPFVTYSIMQMLFSVLLSLLMLISGIGLLTVQNWGRILALITSTLTIFLSFAALIYLFVFVNPALEEYQRWANQRINQWEQARFGRGFVMRPTPPPMGDPVLVTISSVFNAVLNVGYSVVVIIVLLLPHVSATFSGRSPREEFAPDDDDDWRG
jgi:hypothetical protein